MNEELLKNLNTLLPDTLAWLKRLVALNSFTSNAAGVNRVAEATAEMFTDLGFSADLVPSEHAQFGNHLFLKRRGTGAGTPVVLVTHSDTVFPPEEEARNDFRWLESPEENRIYGPGTVDNKGGTVLIWMMLHSLSKVAPEIFDSTTWLVAASASEEVVASDFGRQTRERCPHGARAVLVFEGGPRIGDEFHLVTARKGRAEFCVRAQGRAAHAGSSHAAGVNAVVALANCVGSIAALSDPARDLTVNVATIQGGTVLNRVPHEAELALEMRAFDPAMLTQAEAAIARILSAVDGPATLSLECLGRTAAWPGAEATMDLFARWQRAAGELGFRSVPIKRGGLSDANYLTDLGPILDGLGPAGANAHCSERSVATGKVPEFVEPDSFVPKAALNTLALLSLLRDEPAS